MFKDVSNNVISLDEPAEKHHKTKKLSIKNCKNSIKDLRYETSVYQYFVELKEDSITQKGYLDLVKVPGLYVTGAGSFLKTLRFENQVKQKDIAKIVGIHQSLVSRWEKNIFKISLNHLVKIAETLDVSRDTIYQKIDQGDFFLKTKLPVKIEALSDVISYLYPGKVNVSITKCSDKTLKLIERTFRAKIFYHSKGNNNNQGLINSKDLCNYFTTLFRYSKVSKIQPPLTSEVKQWYDDGVDLKRAIIFPCLQSDGSIALRKNSKVAYVKFYGLNKILHDYFVDAIYYEYNELPTSYFLNTVADGELYTEYSRKKTMEITKEIKKLAGNSKTSPSVGQSPEEYLNEPQPHLCYLINATKTEQKIALRIWASAEGCIGVHRRSGYIYPTFEIGCTHPVLAKDLISIGRKIKIYFTKKYSKKRWSGLGGLINSNICGSLEFLKLGGFIKGVKISSRSKYHKGFTKDRLLLGILEFKKRERGNRHLRKLTLEKVHHKINEILKKREYKSEDYYIDFFS